MNVSFNNQNEGWIRFVSYKVKSVNFKRKDYESEEDVELGDEPNISFNIGASTLNEDLKNFLIDLKLDIESNEVECSIEISGIFETDAKIGEIELHALIINAVSILFPYARSFVSIVSSLDGERPFVLPTINAQRLFTDKEESE